MPMMTRRSLLRATAGVGSAALLSGCVRNSQNAAGPAVSAQHPVIAAHYAYLTAPEIAFVDAAVDRLIPSDTLGPGAAEAGVTLFIDRQLAGEYGKAARWYMQGPWSKGTKFQGYQLQLPPAGLYRAAIAAVDKHCAQAYGGRTFATLSTDEQDSVLHGLEEGSIDLHDVPAKEFFTMLWNNTQEGFFADPIYEGNRDFIGWKLVGFPGPRYNYVSEISHYGQPYPLPTVGLMGRDPTRRPRSMA